MERIGVCVIVLDKKSEQVLLGKRLNSYRAGMLGLPGGRINLKESLKECGKRELLEETALEAKNMEYVGVIRELQDDYNFIHFAFICTDFLGEPQVTEPDKCERWEWYSLTNLPENILPGHKAALDIYLHQDKTTLRDLV
jgi:8-oxo-dGTP diphosphatase